MSEHQRSHIHAPTNLPDLATDKLTAFSGSWLFLLIHVLWFWVWIGLRIEPFPFGLLTMMVSLEAIGLATVVLMSQNRQASKDRLRDDHEAEVVDAMPTILTTILDIVKAVRQINQEQSTILKQQSEILELLKQVPPAAPRKVSKP